MLWPLVAVVVGAVAKAKVLPPRLPQNLCLLRVVALVEVVVAVLPAVLVALVRVHAAVAVAEGHAAVAVAEGEGGRRSRDTSKNTQANNHTQNTRHEALSKQT